MSKFIWWFHFFVLFFVLWDGTEFGWQSYATNSHINNNIFIVQWCCQLQIFFVWYLFKGLTHMCENWNTNSCKPIRLSIRSRNVNSFSFNQKYWKNISNYFFGAISTKKKSRSWHLFLSRSGRFFFFWHTWYQIDDLGLWTKRFV